jgi:formylglycine-generating enzyme required for sulfatase activity
LANANFLYDESGKKIGRGSRTPTETYPPNAFGIEDMLGNVAEWTQNPWRPNYLEIPAPELTDLRVIRGGAWDYMPRLLRPSWRDFSLKNHRRDNLGFRIAATLL